MPLSPSVHLQHAPAASCVWCRPLPACLSSMSVKPQAACTRDTTAAALCWCVWHRSHKRACCWETGPGAWLSMQPECHALRVLLQAPTHTLHALMRPRCRPTQTLAQCQGPPRPARLLAHVGTASPAPPLKGTCCAGCARHRAERGRTLVPRSRRVAGCAVLCVHTACTRGMVTRDTPPCVHLIRGWYPQALEDGTPTH